MASPELASRSGGFISTLANGADDEAIWLQLRDAGFDGETVKIKDKAALISYISKLEKEKYEYKHQMGVLLLERKDWNLKFEQLKASADSAELNYKREKDAHATLLAESSHLRNLLEIEKECNKDIISFYSRKNSAHATLLAESSQKAVGLRKLLGIEEECHKNIREALHDFRVEWAETKKSYKTRLAKARKMPEEAHTKPSQKEALKKYLVIATECIKNIEKGLHDRKLEKRKIEFESDLEKRRNIFEDGIEERKLVLADLEASFNEKENLLQIRLADVAERENDLSLKSKHLNREREILKLAREVQECYLKILERKKNEIQKMRNDIESSRIELEREREENVRTRGELEIAEGERNKLFILDKKLKEEIDNLRAKKKDILAETESLLSEKERFEIEWELIDEEKEDLVRKIGISKD